MSDLKASHDRFVNPRQVQNDCGFVAFTRPERNEPPFGQNELRPFAAQNQESISVLMMVRQARLTVRFVIRERCVAIRMLGTNASEGELDGRPERTSRFTTGINESSRNCDLHGGIPRKCATAPLDAPTLDLRILSLADNVAAADPVLEINGIYVSDGRHSLRRKSGFKDRQGGSPFSVG
jgi:hypothetical protein